MATLGDRLLNSRLFQVQLNLMQLATTLAHNVGFVFTPLNKELIKSKPRLSIHNFENDDPISVFQAKHQVSHSFHDIFQSETHLEYNDNRHIDRREHESLCTYLLRPLELVRIVKRYHVAGNRCILSMIVQVYLLLYLLTKNLFHQIYTGDSQEIADYYAQHYYPRLYCSLPNSHEMYGIINFLCIYVLIVRLLMIIRLLKRSVINQDQYREIEVTQLNGTFIGSMRWPLKDWIRIFFLGLLHKRNCIGDTGKQLVVSDRIDEKDDLANEKEKRDHLYCRSWDWNLSLCTSRSDFLCRANPIDFSRCYQNYGLRLNNNHQSGWYYPKYNCRIDLYEFSWMVALVLLGIPGTIFVILLAMVTGIIIESTVMSPKGYESTLLEGLEHFPDLISSPRNLMRLMDGYIFIVMLIPHQIEAAALYLNVTALLSRIRKLNERLQQDLNFCLHLTDTVRYMRLVGRSVSQTDSDLIINLNHVLTDRVDYDTINTAQKDALNKSLEMSMFLAKTINDEFRMLRKSKTVYLDCLLIVGGFCVAMQLSFMFSTASQQVKVIVFFSIFASAFPVIMCSALCMAVENRVSIPLMKFRIDPRKSY